MVTYYYKILHFCPQSAVTCFTWIVEQTVIVPWYSRSCLFLLAVVECV